MAANRTTGKTVKRRSVSKAASSGPVPPYGPAIWDAVHRGDLNEMTAVAEAARKALVPIKFTTVRGNKAVEAKRALTQLEAAIAKLEPRG